VTELTLLTKPDCHLCDVAREVIDRTLAELPDDVAERVDVTEVSILDDESLYARWWEKIPVVLIDGQLHGHWRVAPDRLKTALESATKES